MAFCFAYRCSGLKVLLALCMTWFLIFISEAAPNFLYNIFPNTSTYNPEISTYQVNLNSLLSKMSSYDITSKNLFYNETAGDSAPDQAYGLYICRGDVTIAICHDCVIAAIREIVEKCPNEKEAYIWYDECMLRYANRSFFFTMDEDVPPVYMLNTGNVTEADRFAQVLGNTMNDLATRASSDQSANGGQMKGFATSEINVTSSIKLQGLVQCTPALSGADCNRCFRVAIGQLPICCSGRPGGRVLLPSCNIRYEMYQFYLDTPTLPPPGKGGISARVIISIVLPVVVSIFLFTLAFCFLRRRTKKFDSIQEATDGNEILIAESLQYDLSTVGAATNHFSAENKIGEGGFGNVFKGTLPNGQEIAVKKL